MNVTFMIGNGFDLNLGLKTGYTDFLKSYLDSNCELDCTNTCSPRCEEYQLKKFKENISKNEQLWSNAELAFGEYTKCYEKEDIEKYCDCHEDFCVNLAKYLKIEQDNIFDKLNIASTKVILYRCLLNCHENLREVERLKIIESMSVYNEGVIFNFLNFNYTNTLATILNKGFSIQVSTPSFKKGYSAIFGEMIHVHGTVDKDMVLGVDDESQISNINLFEKNSDEYLEQIIKVKANEAYGENVDNKALSILNNSSFIYIYGMSIGDTDALWWKRICRLMNDKPSLNIIIHVYNAPDDSLMIRRFKTYKKNLIDKFISFSDLSNEEKENIKERIHIDNKNVFEDLSKVSNKKEITV